MVNTYSLIIVITGSLAAFSEAKFGWGPCTNNVTQIPFSESLSDTYYLQGYDSSVAQLMLNYDFFDCF